ncbi:hypothetical protein BDV25DRAFT_130264 [Aspergillus avenaceus]|uniref:Protein kinase domain-containing protein n=1 Tax=Aspergillus avenaceus TaxID=36643 RepID=A0A5N6TTX2_ASPAV|nr:hypothetical protein BDV25DRAFT_130264 [Aspergillus avenaceus]
MTDSLEISISEMEYVARIKSSEFSCVFRTRWHDKDCILKVTHGLCKKGYIPDFYGCVKQINPRDWVPHLNEFLDDSQPPNAVLLEYVPDMQEIDLSTFSVKRVSQLRQILSEIHAAGVYHGDPFPRNMMVQKDSDRVLWVDFDRAQTFSLDSITARQRQWLDEEDELVDYFVAALGEDYKEGRIHRIWECYYEYVIPNDPN